MKFGMHNSSVDIVEATYLRHPGNSLLCIPRRDAHEICSRIVNKRVQFWGTLKVVWIGGSH